MLRRRLTRERAAAVRTAHGQCADGELLNLRGGRAMSHLQKLLNRLATVDALASDVSEIHALKGEDDFSECLSPIQVSGRFSDLRHRKCLIDYRSVFPLCGQSYHLIGV